MKFSKEDLNWAVSQDLISTKQSKNLLQAFEARYEGQSRFDFAHLAYYFGAFLVIAAMGWLMNDSWERFGGWGIAAVAGAYAILYLLGGWYLYFRKNLRVPGGLLFTLAVWMTPLIIYGVQRAMGLWLQADPGVYSDYYDWIEGGWFFMEVGTILAGVIALRFVRFPFLTFPIAFALWFMSMDLTPLLFGGESFSMQERYWVSVGFGLVMMLVAFCIDHRTKQDYSFWLYLFGLLAFWGGLSSMHSQSQWRKLIYCMINVGLVLGSVMLKRKVFLVFGAMGIFGYLGYLAHDVFQDSLAFSFVLSLIGILILFLGVLYQRYQSLIEEKILTVLPNWLKKHLPQNRPV